MNEKMSALLDDELSAHERDRLLQELGQDPMLRAAWGRYHLIRAALRKDIEVVVNSDLAARVVRRIENDPAPLARPLIRLPMRHFTKLAAGLAIAASVAAVAVVSFKSTLLPDTTHVPVVATAAVDSTSKSQTQIAKAAQDSSLNALLVKHNEFSPAANMNGMMPYVRVVSQRRPISFLPAYDVKPVVQALPAALFILLSPAALAADTAHDWLMKMNQPPARSITTACSCTSTPIN